MRIQNKIDSPKLFILITGLVMTLVSNNFNWTKESWKHILEADAKGYYAYLPATFIYHDLNFGFFDEIEKEKYYNPNTYYDYRSGSNNKVINKYYAGTALAELPFFLVAHLYATVTDSVADGFSKPYMVSVSVAALFYFLSGLLLLNRILEMYSISKWNRVWVIVACTFGTNLFYYVVSEPGLSHVFSFSFFTAFIYTAKRYFLSGDLRWLLFLSLTTGMIVLIRPVNGLILFSLPFIAGDYKTLKEDLVLRLTKEPFKMLLIMVTGSLIVFLQLIIYKVSTGNYIVYSYGEEGFDFLHPHLIDILFSYKKGLFLYTPIYLVSLFGLYKLWKDTTFTATSLFLFLFVTTYVFSSWWMWYYGGSFSSRVFVEFLPFFMIPLGILLESRLRKKLIIPLIVVLTIVCQIQIFQYRYYEIHWSEMTKEKYWNVFLRVDRLINKETNPVPPVEGSETSSPQ